MSPDARTSVVPRTGDAAGRAHQRVALELHAHFDVALVEGQTHVPHAPRPLDAQQLLVESRLGHAASVPTGRTKPSGHSQHLTEDELILYREWIENNRELQRLVKEMRHISSRVLALITGRKAS